MKQSIVFLAMVALLFLAACTPTNIKPPQTTNSSNYVSVTFTIDPDGPTATATTTSALGTQVLQDASNNESHLQLGSALATTNVVHGGKRYIAATFEFTNDTGADLENLYFVARDINTTAGGTPNSPFSSPKNFAGTPISIPASMKLAHAQVYDPAANAMVTASETDYVTGLDIANATITDKTGLFTEGFRAENAARNATAIPAGQKGRVIFSVELDNLAGSSDDPFTFTLNFYRAKDTNVAASTAGCTASITCIHAIQGSSATPPLLNSTVTVDAVVTAVYPNLKGFFIQEEDADADSNTATSDGIFVYQNAAPTVSIGDRVTVAGTVGEFRKMTQITSPTITVLSNGNALPTPASVSLPVPATMTVDAFYEQFEGMLTRFTDKLTVTEYYQLARYGEVMLSQGGRLRQYTDGDQTPTTAEYATHLENNARRSIILEDDRTGSNVFLGGTNGDNPSQDSAYPYPEGGFSTTNYFRGGDTIDNLTVITTYFENSSGSFKTWQFRPVYSQYDYTFTKANPRSATPPSIGTSNVKVASFNVLNYFTTLNSRGANSTAELRRQEAKIVAAICALDADVVGLIEIENDADVSLSNLVSALNTGVDADGDGSNDVAACSQPYTAVSTGKIGTDEITVAFIYRASTVSLQGSFATLTDTAFLRPNGGTQDRNRPALAQSFRLNSNNGVFTVVVNHLKSKGGNGSGADADQNDGQANYNSSRTKGAQALMDWLATDPTSSGDSDVLVIGDLNAYRYEDPVQAIRNGSDDTQGTTDDFVDVITAADTSLYSYVFGGQVGFLDHALASSSLNAQVTGATIWNINADEVNIFDYNDGINDNPGNNNRNFEPWYYRKSTKLPVYEANVYRASDHDPVLVGLSLNADTAPPADTTAPTVQSLSPADDATDVAVDSNLELTFSETISKGTGNIVIHKASDNSAVETIDVTSGQVTVSGNKATINPSNNLANTTDYYVTVAAGSFKDAANNTFAGITDTITWNFTTAAASSGNQPTDLFFSEYIEGSSSNKALEIFNGTGAGIDLSAYSIQRYNNGATTSSSDEALSGTLANNDVYVIANSSANAAIQGKADITSGSFTFFNGDDAIALLKNGVIIDVVGQIGVDPGSEWGTGDTSTANNTLRRKPTVCSGDTNGTDTFDPALEWDGFPLDNADDLGQHSVSCS